MGQAVRGALGMGAHRHVNIHTCALAYALTRVNTHTYMQTHTKKLPCTRARTSWVAAGQLGGCSKLGSTSAPLRAVPGPESICEPAPAAQLPSPAPPITLIMPVLAAGRFWAGAEAAMLWGAGCPACPAMPITTYKGTWEGHCAWATHVVAFKLYFLGHKG